MPVAVHARLDRSSLFVLGLNLSLALVSILPAQDSPPGKESETREMQWVRDSLSPATTPYRTEATTVRVGDRTLRTSVLQRPSPEGRLTDSVIVEEETVKESPTKSRRIQKLFNQSDGQRLLVEIVEEETVEQAGGNRTATRVISKPDLNGNQQVTRREVEKTVHGGPDSSTTESTVFLPSVNGDFESVGQTRRTESRDQKGKLRIDQERLVRYEHSDAWNLQERVTRVVEKEGEVEEVYRLDPQGQFPLSQRSITTRRKDPDGQQHEVTEVYSRNVEGFIPSSDNELRLDRRISIHSTPQPDHGTKVVKEIEQRGLADPRGPLRTVERVVELSSPDGRTHQEIQTSDASGALKTSSVIETRKTIGK